MKKFVWITDAVLNNPFNVDDFEISCEHERFIAVHTVFSVASAPVDAFSTKAKFLFKHSCGWYHLRSVDTERKFEV